MPSSPLRGTAPYDGVVADVSFADRLGEAVESKRSQLVVGLDPRLDLLPVELSGEAVLGRASAASAVARFCKGIVDAVGPYVVAVKPQSAFFEALGADGIRALEEVCDYARSTGLLVIVDAKRGDIGSTARAYATAFLEPRDGDPGPLPRRSFRRRAEPQFPSCRGGANRARLLSGRLRLETVEEIGREKRSMPSRVAQNASCPDGTLPGSI